MITAIIVATMAVFNPEQQFSAFGVLVVLCVECVMIYGIAALALAP